MAGDNDTDKQQAVNLDTYLRRENELLEVLEEETLRTRQARREAERDMEDPAAQEEKGLLERIGDWLKDALVPPKMQEAIRQHSEALEHAGFEAAKGINDERRAMGLPPLEIDDALAIVGSGANSLSTFGTDGLERAVEQARETMHHEIEAAGEGEPGRIAPGSTPGESKGRER